MMLDGSLSLHATVTLWRYTPPFSESSGVDGAGIWSRERPARTFSPQPIAAAESPGPVQTGAVIFKASASDLQPLR